MSAFPRGVCVAAVLVAAAIATQCQQVKQAGQSHPTDLDYEIVFQTSLVNNGITVDVLRVCSVATTPANLSTRAMTANKAVADITAKGWPVDEQGQSKAIMVVWLLPDKVTEQGVFMYAPNVPFAELYGKPSPSAAPPAKARQRTSRSTRVTKPKPSKQEDDMAAINARCQRQMGSHGASMVKYCIDQDMAAYEALQHYPRKHRSIIDRCKRTMLATGGWSVVQYCADEDIAAAKALEGY